MRVSHAVEEIEKLLLRAPKPPHIEVVEELSVTVGDLCFRYEMPNVAHVRKAGDRTKAARPCRETVYHRVIGGDVLQHLGTRQEIVRGL